MTDAADVETPEATPAEGAETESYENGEVIDSPTVNAYVVGVEIIGPPDIEIEPPADGGAEG